MRATRQKGLGKKPKSLSSIQRTKVRLDYLSRVKFEDFVLSLLVSYLLEFQDHIGYLAETNETRQKIVQYSNREES